MEALDERLRSRTRGAMSPPTRFKAASACAFDSTLLRPTIAGGRAECSGWSHTRSRPSGKWNPEATVRSFEVAVALAGLGAQVRRRAVLVRGTAVACYVSLRMYRTTARDQARSYQSGAHLRRREPGSRFLLPDYAGLSNSAVMEYAGLHNSRQADVTNLLQPRSRSAVVRDEWPHGRELRARRVQAPVDPGPRRPRRSHSRRGVPWRTVAYRGGCGAEASVSTLSLLFREARGRTTIVVAERLRVVRLQWIHAERLEVDYRSRNPGVIREQLVRSGTDSVRVVFRRVAGRTR